MLKILVNCGNLCIWFLSLFLRCMVPPSALLYQEHLLLGSWSCDGMINDAVWADFSAWLVWLAVNWTSAASIPSSWKVLLSLPVDSYSWITSTKSPSFLHDNLQRESHKLCGSPTLVTWLQLLRKQTNTGTSTALIAGARWCMRSRFRVISVLVTWA